MRDGEAPDAVARRLRTMLDVSVALNAVADLDHLLGAILETTRSVLRCEAASILLHDAEAGVLRFAAARGGEPEALAGVEVPLDGSLAGVIFRENRPLLAADVAADERHFAAITDGTAFTPRVLLGVPMRIDGAPVGVLEALNPREGSFDKADAEMLLILSAQAAVAIRNANLRADLEAARDRLGDLDRVKSAFMAMASHELRTPLTAIQGFGQVLAEEATGALAEYAGEVLGAASRMHEVIESLDEVSTFDEARSISLGHERPGAEPVDLGALAREVAAEGEREVPTDAIAEVWVSGDARRLRLVLRHLVRNAIAFTPHGEPVRVRVRPLGREAAIEVEDAGVGLDEADLDRIFEPFTQVDESLARTHEGIGMGLAVARAIVARHGGRIWATSEGVGMGSTFHVRLPLAT